MFSLLLPLFSLFLILPGVHCSQMFKVLLTYQSQNTSYSVWCEYFTLCLAPLAAHVIAGVEFPTIIEAESSKPPPWHERLPHFNPISVIWRWNAIAYRRVRAAGWDAIDMAACNAVFWDSHMGRWDGSEERMITARALNPRAPRHNRAEFISASSLTTLILAFQGIQACFVIFAHVLQDDGVHYKRSDGLANVFVPIGCMGLLRLPAALWLSSEYDFSMTGTEASTENHELAERPGRRLDSDAQSYPLLSSDSAGASTFPTSTTDKVEALPPTRLKASNTLPALLFRAYWAISFAAILGSGAVFTTATFWHMPTNFPYLSTSHVLFNSTYFYLSSIGMLTTVFYLIIGRTDTTIIPCISLTWYKVFTALFYVAALALVIVDALETRLHKNSGTTTTLPGFWCNVTALAEQCVPAAMGQGNFNL